MQAIKTKYLPATNNKPSRIKAECDADTITIPYDYRLESYDAHRKAMYLLLSKLEWEPIRVHTGGLSDCYVHVLEFSTPIYLDMQDLPEFLKPQV